MEPSLVSSPMCPPRNSNPRTQKCFNVEYGKSKVYHRPSPDTQAPVKLLMRRYAGCCPVAHLKMLASSDGSAMGLLYATNRPCLSRNSSQTRLAPFWYVLFACRRDSEARAQAPRQGGAGGKSGEERGAPGAGSHRPNSGDARVHRGPTGQEDGAPC